MKGITPVITTVLLLLMGIAAIGGSWVFIQKIQTSSTTSASGQFENFKAQASTLITYDSVTYTNNAGSTDDVVYIKLANPGSVAAKVTKVIVENQTGDTFYNSTTNTIPANDFATIKVIISGSTGLDNFCPDEEYAKLTVYSDAFKPIASYPIKCDY